ncbi:unnamed protein product [marine sediment metagenome]|uniref:Uncharacterized protein n=1 Tax=marine sediment metagenome TaxID=412755 RepID=X1TXZ8_9ZZZZ
MGNILAYAGIRKDVTLEFIGWLSFVLGLVIPEPALGAILMVIARALPKTLYS